MEARNALKFQPVLSAKGDDGRAGSCCSGFDVTLVASAMLSCMTGLMQAFRNSKT